jgi:putative peptide zinc metalloprotease protein
MCLSPALYCNVTDAWTMADKWKRIIISFAGIYVELIIASIATFVWWYTPHLPLVNNVSLCVMVLCSVSTIVFNANPLMRFDGYYIMADWLEIPNLRDRSNRFITNLFQEKCLGIEVPPEPYMATGRKVLFVTYAIASYVYRWVITFSIIWFLSDFLGPQLKILSRMLAAVCLISMFIWPVYRMIKNIRQRGRLPDMKMKRVWISSVIFASFLAFCFLAPLPISRVLDTGLVVPDPAAAEPVGLIDPGQLTEILVKEGQRVRKGETLARFEGLELREQLAKAQAERNEQAAVAEALERDARLSLKIKPENREVLLREMQSARDRVSQYDTVMSLLRGRLREMQELKAPRDGIVMGLPKQQDIGKMFDKNYLQGKPVCTIADPSKLLVKLPVGASDYRLLKEDLSRSGSLPASVYVSGRTDQIFQGRVVRLPESDSKQVPPALTQRAGGPLAVKQAGEQGQEVTPLAQTYLVDIELLDPDTTVKPGAQVTAKIHCRWRSVSWWIGRKIAEALDIGLY